MAAKFHMNYEAPFVSAMGDFAEHLVETAGKTVGAMKAAVTTVLTHLHVWQIRIDQRRHLQELDRRLLSDMGFSFEQADREAAKPFWRG
ncbi:DUF1127 domain-containing protein [Aestuariispira insulae]|uniref:Uncharacterized protein DUF1127 n=1 Tax=Aestuariispira insulae TaxID=1461337 RepID=A0A3D9HI19_9PROT|nr:DUF1127 domain-containing protein [Aestuariispira insulae]RED49120.1 uncharacterized protein DUF1127 [Aestuariispira insulae]